MTNFSANEMKFILKDKSVGGRVVFCFDFVFDFVFVDVFRYDFFSKCFSNIKHLVLTEVWYFAYHIYVV